MKSLKTISLTILAIFCLVVVQGQIKMGQGVTSPNDWVNYNTTGIYVDVNTTACAFKTTPHYLVTLESIGNKGFHWYISGTSSIYNATPTGFRIYLRWADAPSDLPTVGSLNFPNPLRASTAKNREWVIRWTGIEMKDCGKSVTGSSTGEIFPGANGGEGNKVSLESGTPNINSLKIYPNPGKDRVVIQYSGFIKKSEIYDLNSRLLGVSTTNSINIKKLPKGNYIIKVYTEDDKIITKQFVK
ncbi:T9SS type A sorting domain-containing protein [Aquimarina macrocephali]|uniref:T9SS type A sorting domain-containing protein n=1 Tax=Aquimarina macrocephali TaxID=666563 RepID=UPI0004658156|nr:T9SS type A sorting domain-containing protein [Aquimarina macrocephali]